MDIKKYRLKLTLTEPMLGTLPQKKVAEEYILSKFEERVLESAEVGGPVAAAVLTNDHGLPEDESGTVNEELTKATTAFHHNAEGGPVLYDYQFKGFMKEAGQVHNGEEPGEGDKKLKALRSKIDNLLFVFPRSFPIQIPEDAWESLEGMQGVSKDKNGLYYLERPLRAQTMQGPRVALARSEIIPAGGVIQVELEVLGNVLSEKLLRTLLDYGRYKGLGQWRNGSYGRFKYELAPYGSGTLSAA